jgi:uncharacterized delta-60 repeat protein
VRRRGPPGLLISSPDCASVACDKEAYVRIAHRWPVPITAAITILLFLLFSPSAQAEGGDLDATFDGDGRVTTHLGALDEATAVAVQPDGKIIAVGESDDPDPGVFTKGFLVRYESTGGLDATFDGDGIVDTFPLFPFSRLPRDVAVQDDGKIVVAGNAGVARFNPDGTPDTSFGDDGFVTADSRHFDEGFEGIALQPNGKIVVVATTRAFSEGGLAAIARFNADGTNDTSFSDDGKRLLRHDPSNTGASAVSIQANGRIVVAGGEFPQRPGGSRFTLFRLRADGDLDRSFGGDGHVRTDFGDGGARAFDVALQAVGKLVAVGYTGLRPARRDFALARYTKAGRLDATFSHDGKKRTNFTGGLDEARGVVIQANGRIVVAGFAAPQGHRLQANFGLARYRTNGELNSTFSENGRVRTRFGANNEDFGNDIALQPNGRIVVAGSATVVRHARDFGIARYLAH